MHRPSAADHYLDFLKNLNRQTDKHRIVGGLRRADTLARDIVDVANAFCLCSRRSRCAVCSGRQSWWEYTIVPDLAAAAFAELALVVMPKKGLSGPRPTRSFYPQSAQQRPSPDRVLGFLAISLANCIASSRRLCCLGFDAQARHVVRLYSELADTLIAVAFSEDYFRRYVNAPHDSVENFRYWRTHLKPTITRDIVIDALKHIGLDQKTQDSMRQMLEHNYRWLSAFSHAHWLGQVVGSLVQNADTDTMAISIFGGKVDDASRATLGVLRVHIWLTMSVLRRLLFDRHGWNEARPRSKRRGWLFTSGLVGEAHMRLRAAELAGDG